MAFEELEHPITATTVRFAPGQHAKYVPNHRSFGAFMRSDQMRDVTTDVAQAIAMLAEATQPPPSSDTDPERASTTYSVKREAGYAKVGGNLRVKVTVTGTGAGAERAEFGGHADTRYRTLGKAGAKFGDLRHTEALG